MNRNESSATMAIADASEAGFELRITRVFDAPRELVWKAWTDPGMAKQWIGPRGFQTTEFEVPSQVGSPWRLVMEGFVPAAKGTVRLAQGGTTLEVVPPEKLVYTFAWEDRAALGLSAAPAKESLVTVLFEDHGAKTVMHFTQSPFATEGERDGHTGGWNSSFDRFAEFVLTEQPERRPAEGDVPSELHLERFFAASREVVFDAWTKPEQLAKWWGPECFTNPVCEVDARGGGKIYIEMKAPDGTVYPMSGQFVEFFPPYRLHFTSGPLDKDGKLIFELWNSVFFAEVEGGTEVVLDVHVVEQTAEAPQYLKGMSAGWNQSLSKLDALVTEELMCAG